MSVENPMLPQEKIEQILGEAMLNAITRCLADSKFSSRLLAVSAETPATAAVEEEPREAEKPATPSRVEPAATSPVAGGAAPEVVSPRAGARPSDVDF